MTAMKTDWRALILLLMFIPGCAVFDGDQDVDGAQDSAEEVRLKAVLLEADNLGGAAIDVTIDQETILLEGFVETDAQRKRAENLMRENSDIDSVTNRLEVR